MNMLLQKIFENEYVKHMVVGLSAIAVISIMIYVSPFLFILALGLCFLMLMSLGMGYIIVDSYKIWRENHDKNQSRKKAPPSKNGPSN